MKTLHFSLTLILLLFIKISSFGQFQLFVKFFMKDDKKVISIVEKDAFKVKNEVKVENSEVYDFLKTKSLSDKKEIPYSDYLKIIEKELDANKISNRDASQLTLENQIKKIATIDLETPMSQAEYSKFLKDHNISPISVTNLIRHTPPKLPPPTPLSLKNLSNVKVFISIPSSEKEFKNIFKNYNNSQYQDVTKLRTMLKDENNANVDFLTSKDFLSKMFSDENEKEKSFIIIGHNENGSIFLPDGSSVKIEDIDKMAKEHSKLIIYLSCNAHDFTTNPAANFFLTYQEAIRLTHRIDFSNTHTISPDFQKTVIQAIINNYSKEKRLKYNLKVIAYTSIASTAGYGIYQIRGQKK